jgi:hypothetical protein
LLAVRRPVKRQEPALKSEEKTLSGRQSTGAKSEGLKRRKLYFYEGRNNLTRSNNTQEILYIQ